MLKAISALAAFAVAAVLVVPTVTQAADSNSVRVSYADLNLSTNHGQQVLQGRIVWAARTVCEIEDSRELPLASATKLCRTDAIDRARPQYEAAVAAARHGTVTILSGAAVVVTSH